MGVAVFSGMIGVTVFGLFLTPVFYVLLRAAHRQRAAQARHGDASRSGAAPAVAGAAGTEAMDEHHEIDSRSSLARCVLAPAGRTGAGRLRHRHRPTAAARRRPQFKERDPALDACACSPPRRSRAANGGRRSPTRCSTIWSSAPTARNTTSRWRRRASLRRARCCAAADADRLPQVGLGGRRVRGDGLSAPASRPAARARCYTRRRERRPTSWTCSAASRRRATPRSSTRTRAEALLQSTRLLVQADVAQTYLGLRALDDERALVRGTVAAYRDTLRAHRAPLPRGRRRRARRGARADRSGGHGVRGAGARSPAAPSWSTRSPCWSASRASNFAHHGGRLGDGAARDSRRACRDGARRGGPTSRPRSSGMLAAQARVGVAQAAWFPNIVAHRAGRLRLDRPRRPLQVVGARVGRSARCSRCRSSTAAGARPACRAPAAQIDAAVAHYREQVLVAFREVEDQLAALRLLARAVRRAGAGGDLRGARHGALGCALPQRPREPARAARRAAQRAQRIGARPCR